MAKEPTYPEDAAVGDAVGKKEQTKAPEPQSEGSSVRTRNMVTGAAIGIGSAALVAALLYANRSRKGPKPRS